ncbi:MAG TPA: CpaF family protein [Candidatus Aenigmarchaeota archaeon]|nr:CpaF family protein [Candidatus Aenigmarchaeota archaeon]
MEKILENYEVSADWVKAEVTIKRTNDFAPIYELKLPKIEKGTKALLDRIRSSLLAEIPIKLEVSDVSKFEEIKKRHFDKGMELIKKELPMANEKIQRFLIGMLIHEMFGLGKIELLLSDPNLEEVVINGSKSPIWVYHKKFGWLKTNLFVESEDQVLNYANSIGRRVGRQITVLNPLMDAHLITGDRVNATLFPISTLGNTITIRKFRRSPWTITDFLENKTLSYEVAAWLWEAIQYEMNIIIAGGTASGKTSLLNVLMSFIPPNHRVISIEDTREIQLPEFLHWIPLTTREPNPEGLGEVTMLDLLVNSLRMRPDRIIVGEIRRAREAEVLFEAMHTGHSVYATLHADTAEQAYKRLVNPPINVPEAVLEALHLIAVCFRDRRLGIRRLFEVAEIIPSGEAGRAKVSINVLFRWKPYKDEISKEGESYRFIEELRMHTGMSDDEIKKDIEDKLEILKWFVRNNVRNINEIGRVVARYYLEPEFVLDCVKRNEKLEKVVKW